MTQVESDASQVIAGRVNSWNEFSPLREVVVGTAAHARIPDTMDRSSWLNLFGDMKSDELAAVRTGRFPNRVIEQTAEDLDVLVATLTGLGVTVHRPEEIDPAGRFGTPEWSSDGFYFYCPRDLALVVGDTIIETPSPMRARYFELFGLKSLFTSYLRNGSRWISAPRPRLSDELYGLGPSGLPELGELEPAFEAANVLRLGRDILYQVSSSGNELGRVWLESTLRGLGDFRVHPLRGIYDFTHIDSTIAVLRPGLVLLNPERVSEATLPAVFRGWDVLWCPPMTGPKPASRYPLSSPWVGMNLFMVSPELAIVDAEQHDLVSAIEAKGIEVLPHRLRHSRVLGGGFHCVTLDVARDGGPDDVFA